MQQLVEELKEAIAQFNKTLEAFPKSKRETVLFDRWSLKDMVTHLTGWANYQIGILRAFRKRGESEPESNPKNAINTDLVAERAGWNWEKVYREFKKTTRELIAEYAALTTEQWHQQIWKNQEMTPREFIRLEINHYAKTHGPQVARAMKKFLTAASTH